MEVAVRRQILRLLLEEGESRADTAEDVSAFGQHRKFPPHARKTSGTQGKPSVFLASLPSLSLVFSLAPDLLFDCSRVLEYAKIRTVLQCILVAKYGVRRRVMTALKTFTLCSFLTFLKVSKPYEIFTD